MIVTSETTPQQIFDHVATHLITQGRQSKMAHGSGCKYRGVDNLSCAIGCLIPDNLYSEALENRSVHRLLGVVNGKGHSHGSNLSYEQEDYLILFNPHEDLLQKLQDVHDGPIENPDYSGNDERESLVILWKERLRAVALIFKLEVNFDTPSAEA